MTDQTPPRPASTEPTNSPVPRARCEREGCRAAFTPTAAWHRFLLQVRAGQSQRRPRRRPAAARPCPRPVRQDPPRPKRSQTPMLPRCRQTAAITRRPAPTTPRDKLVRRLSDEGMVLAERIEAYLLAHPDHAARDVAAISG